MRVIATQTNEDIGITEEEEVISLNEQFKEVLLQIGLARPYDDTKPLPTKGLNDYELGMIYPKDRFIIKNDSLYKSKQTTSTTWVELEWDLKITGTAKV